ncbi:MAG TPA: pyruvate kinase, partial [Pseudobacillus sp.]
VNQAWTLYQKAANQAALIPLIYPRIHHTFSAQNLMAFLAYRNSAHPKFINALHSRGLCLSSNQSMMQSLQILCSNLGISLPLHALDSNAHSQLTKKRGEAVLGGKSYKNSPRIMVTLDGQMTSPSIIERFLLNGMTIARINCAYGESSTWKRVIETIRCAEEQLRKKGDYRDQKCQIYMDLAGPKIRVGPIKKITYPLKIGIKKDRYGRPLRAKKGLISCQSITTKQLTNEEYDFIISTSPCERFQQFSKGDYLSFIDNRNKKRKFLITDVSSTGLIVTLEKTVYINENTKLKSMDGEVELCVKNLEESPILIDVKKGDFLRIYLNRSTEGHPAAGSASAALSVSLPEAFTAVQEGDRIFIDDGKIQALARRCTDDFIDTEIISPNTYITIKENKGINLPDCKADLTIPALTKKDEKDLAFICEHADMVGISFVHRPEDLQKLQQLLRTYPQKDLAVIAKIETKEAINNFTDILLEGLSFSKFGVMIARGDLAIEIGFHKLPIVQEEILSLCRAAHVPVILATQVLESLAKKGAPSRAELADLSFGSKFDCLMLNKGPFMEETLEFLTETLFLISEVKDYKQMITRSLAVHDERRLPLGVSLAELMNDQHIKHFPSGD